MPRKIPQQSRAVQMVAAILEAAACVLETQGLQAFTTNRVALRAGISVGSLYQYFPGKDALIVALALRERALLLAEAQSALKETTGRKALKHLIAVATREQLRRPILARLLDFEETRAPIARELAPSLSPFHELMQQILSHKDIPAQPDIKTAVDDLANIIRVLVDAAGDRGEINIKDLEQRIERTVSGYLGLAPGPRKV
ncbi:TetR/AcrR family transcriptional regulator [Paraburkholderia sp. USG1]|uniref:TetR/AcrR family transcriptional regulator n=1 Tax=Paraburkholderia sp. USG1 TaxID=2952268 RepID=UPI00285F2081|nr:helix-turn-helix domain-containing protein [Paraburkholderia sp. USG1]MDR8398313.1 TetR/AcrR family transcriptional regulator [Paraburkholderia sp. USG1]